MQKMCLFLTFVLKAWIFFFSLSEVENFSLVSTILIIIILTIKLDSYQNVVDESSKRIYAQKSALKLLHKFDLCIFPYNLSTFAIFHDLNYDYFNLCKSSVYVLSKIMMRILYLPFLSWCHSNGEYIPRVETGAGSLLEPLIAITGNSIPFLEAGNSPSSEVNVAQLRTCWGDVRGAHVNNFNAVWSFTIIQRARL